MPSFYRTSSLPHQASYGLLSPSSTPCSALSYAAYHTQNGNKRVLSDRHDFSSAVVSSLVGWLTKLRQRRADGATRAISIDKLERALDLARKATQLGMTSTGEFLGYVKRQGDEEGVAGGRASEGEEETMAEGIQMEAMDRKRSTAVVSLQEAKLVDWGAWAAFADYAASAEAWVIHDDGLPSAASAELPSSRPLSHTSDPYPLITDTPHIRSASAYEEETRARSCAVHTYLGKQACQSFCFDSYLAAYTWTSDHAPLQRTDKWHDWIKAVIDVTLSYSYENTTAKTRPRRRSLIPSHMNGVFKRRSVRPVSEAYTEAVEAAREGIAARSQASDKYCALRPFEAIRELRKSEGLSINGMETGH